MDDIYLKCFNELKKEIEKTFFSSYPACKTPIEDWKGQHITNFQEELISKAGGSISEKWFYTHIKSETKKVPRQDMLNLLSKYVGYRDWEEFLASKTNDIKQEVENVQKKKSLKPVFIVIGTLLIALTLYFIFTAEKEVPTYKFCFIDGDTNELVKDSTIEITILKKDETPQLNSCNEKGCFEIKTNDNKITFVVNAPYYKIDTIYRKLSGLSRTEKIKLKTDDYALMIHIFSTSKIDDWRRRKAQLEDMIADDARIIQVSNDNSKRRMELYNKTGFINKLTIPTKSLKNIKVLSTVYKNNKISILRFTQIN